MNSSINRARTHTVSRIYHTAKDAARAMGISPVHYHRLCKVYGSRPRQSVSAVRRLSGSRIASPS